MNNMSSCYKCYSSTRLTFSCRFSSTSLLMSDWSLLHFSCTFFISGSSCGAAAGTEAAVGSAFTEFITGAALVASTSFCQTGREAVKSTPACPELSREVSLQTGHTSQREAALSRGPEAAIKETREETRPSRGPV